MALVIAEGPQLANDEQKRIMIKDLTEVTAKYVGLMRSEIVVLIREEGGDRMSAGRADIVGWNGEPA